MTYNHECWPSPRYAWPFVWSWNSAHIIQYIASNADIESDQGLDTRHYYCLTVSNTCLYVTLIIYSYLLIFILTLTIMAGTETSWSCLLFYCTVIVHLSFLYVLLVEFNLLDFKPKFACTMESPASSDGSCQGPIAIPCDILMKWSPFGVLSYIMMSPISF